jgi:hypothetical protein
MEREMVLRDVEGVGRREEICANAGVTRKAQQSFKRVYPGGADVACMAAAAGHSHLKLYRGLYESLCCPLW